MSKAAAVVPFILCIIAANWLTASFGPDVNLPKLLGWLREAAGQMMLRVAGVA